MSLSSPVSAQASHYCAGAGRLAVELGLLGKEAPNVIRSDRSDVDDAITEAGQQKTSHDT